VHTTYQAMKSINILQVKSEQRDEKFGNYRAAAAAKTLNSIFNPLYGINKESLLIICSG
jgi:hypothetical protein